jgi:hypothetical protein
VFSTLPTTILPTHGGRTMPVDSTLAVSLSGAVPLWAMKIRQEHPSDWDYIKARAEACSQVIAEHGDNILFKSKKPGETARAFNALAEAIACLSFLPGGVTVFGQHWENEL